MISAQKAAAVAMTTLRTTTRTTTGAKREKPWHRLRRKSLDAGNGAPRFGKKPSKGERRKKTALRTAVAMMMMDLNDVTAVSANGAFVSLFVASSVYGTKAVFFPDSDDGKKEKEKKATTKEGFNVERTALQLSNAALVLALGSRWVESGHFPLSNMYESLLFLAWGTTATAIYVN